MLEIYIDGDACPVKDEVLKVAERHKLKVHLVSNRWLRLNHSLVNQVLVADGADVADDWIAEHVGLGDIVITADIPLADRCIKKQAQVIGTTGKPFTEETISMTLAMRNLMTHIRETENITSHNKSFCKQDRSRFLSSLETAVQAAKKIAQNQS